MLEEKRSCPSHSGREAAPCAVANLAPLRWPAVIFPACNVSHARSLSPTSRSSGHGSSWRSRAVNRCSRSPCAGSATPPPCGASAAATRRPDSRPSWLSRTARDVPSGFPPLQRARIIQLACLEPVAKGLHITHWSSAELARQAVRDGIIDTISPRSVRRILQAVDLQPHRTRFWKTARLNAEFLERAVRILWCYIYADQLARRGYWVVCTDEARFQVLERVPVRPAIPGSSEPREVE